MTTQDQAQSFYFFDFDDNIMFMETTILIQNTVTSEITELSTAEFAHTAPRLGVPGAWQEYTIFDNSYKYFRDIATADAPDEQYFIRDIKQALDSGKKWQAPSWAFFAHACAKQRPLAIITARGHEPDTMKAGIRVLLERGFIEQEPNYLNIYPVSNDNVRRQLGDKKLNYTIPTLKKLAIFHAVEMGLEQYGADLPHQFGMSDDDSRNLNLVIEAMHDCKLRHDDKRFFVFNTHVSQNVKLEVLPMGMP